MWRRAVEKYASKRSRPLEHLWETIALRAMKSSPVSTRKGFLECWKERFSQNNGSYLQEVTEFHRGGDVYLISTLPWAPPGLPKNDGWPAQQQRRQVPRLRSCSQHRFARRHLRLQHAFKTLRCQKIDPL